MRGTEFFSDENRESELPISLTQDSLSSGFIYPTESEDVPKPKRNLFYDP
jgi:hypothetical protein